MIQPQLTAYSFSSTVRGVRGGAGRLRRLCWLRQPPAEQAVL
jgi:hypothetical protein